jgi:hypothetical protein
VLELFNQGSMSVFVSLGHCSFFRRRFPTWEQPARLAHVGAVFVAKLFTHQLFLSRREQIQGGSNMTVVTIAVSGSFSCRSIR